MNLLSDGNYHKAIEFKDFVAQTLLYYEALVKQWIQIIFNSIINEDYLVDLDGFRYFVMFSNWC